MSRSVSRVSTAGRGADLVVVSVTAPTERRAATRGPTVVITANIHGDECTGTGAVLRLIPLLEAQLLTGTVHLYPSLNPDGLERRTRRVPEDDQDLNRLFPGDPAGSPAERLAQAAWTDIAARQPDVLVDLHADAPGAVAYALLDRAVNQRPEPRARLEAESARLAAATGLTVVHEYPDDRYLRFRLDRSLTGAALNRLGIPAVTVEAGPRMVLDSPAIDLTIRAVLGLLGALGMVEPPPPPPQAPTTGGPWRREAGPRVSTKGVLVPRVPAGALLRRGDVVAEVRALSGALLEEVVAEAAGFVLAPAERAHVVPGVPVCTWAMAEAPR